uniref:C2H2-type domain-containing protein n=1 Tax=Ciona savignyi TaxID=51511 RepID=H2ZLY7_CIOSA
MNMLAGPNQSGVYTVSINPSVATHVITQPSGVPVPPLSIITQPNQQIAQRRMPQIMQAGQVVNLSSPVRSTTQVTKPYTCTHCQKTLSSRYNVVRHEKICKSNTAAQNLQQDQPQLPQSQQPHQQQPAHQQQMDVKNPFQCYFCHKTGFSSQESVSKHQKKCKNNPSNQVQREHHEHGRRVHICKYCAKEFS